MAKSMGSYIEIGNYVFKSRLNSAVIREGRKRFGNTATIKLPNIEGVLEKNIQPGDKVVVRLGYDGVLNDEFKGYVKSITPKVPIEIECEDEMYQLRRKPIEPKSWQSVKLKDLVEYIVPGSNINTYDITLSPFRIERDTESCAVALEQIKDEFGLDVYFRGSELYVGLAYQEDVGQVNYHFQQNIPSNQTGLTFKYKDELRLKVRAISLDRNNKKTEVVVGDKNGEVHTLHFYNKTDVELKALALERINLLKYEGYRGKFKAKGIPRVTFGMIANMFDSRYPNRAGSYFIDDVLTTYNGDSGFSRKIELGRKVSVELIEN